MRTLRLLMLLIVTSVTMAMANVETAREKINVDKYARGQPVHTEMIVNTTEKIEMPKIEGTRKYRDVDVNCVTTTNYTYNKASISTGKRKVRDVDCEVGNVNNEYAVNNKVATITRNIGGARSRIRTPSR